MIRFQDTTEKKDTAEFLSSPVLKEVKSDTVTPEEARDFWDAVFSNEPVPVQELTMDDLVSEIYGRTEDEFEFDVKIDPKTQAILDHFNIAAWDRLSDDEKMALVEALAKAIGKELDLEKIPEIQYFEGPLNNQGAYDPEDRTISINKALLNDPKALVETLPHELRHAYQRERSLKQETWMDLLYTVNLDPDYYISPVALPDGKWLFFTDYYDQLVEAEARAYANVYAKEEA